MRSVAACSAAFCAGISMDVAWPAIAIAPLAMPAARKGTLIIRNPASVEMSLFTLSMPSLTRRVGPLGAMA